MSFDVLIRGARVVGAGAGEGQLDVGVADVGEGHRTRGLELDLIARATSGYVARRFGLRGKGRLEPGADADFVLVDLQASEALSAEDLHHRHRHSPFVGRTLSARVVRKLVRGRTVLADGRIVGPPAGRLLIPATRMESS
jgi:allantoinase